MDRPARSLEYQADDMDLEAVSRGLLEDAADAGYRDPALADLRLIVEEVVTNVRKHAQAGSEPARIEWWVGPDTVQLRFVDGGIPFDPRAPSDESLQAADHTTGKMGLLLIRKLAQSIDYDRQDGRNELTIVYVPASAAPATGATRP